MEKKLMYLLNKFSIFSAFLFAAILLGYGCFQNNFPTSSEIDNFILAYNAQKNAVKMPGNLKALLERLSDPRTKEDDEIIQYAMNKFSKLYLSTPDDGILEVFDSTHIDAGFANFVCGFYSDIRHEKRFQERLRRNSDALKGVQRCLGITFSDQEIKILLKG